MIIRTNDARQIRAALRSPETRYVEVTVCGQHDCHAVPITKVEARKLADRARELGLEAWITENGVRFDIQS